MDLNSNVSAGKIEITGVVQGVGFRPFLFQLARHYNLNGQVSNTGQGVTLVVEGPEEKIRAFCRDIPAKSPPLSSINHVHYRPVPVQGFDAFTICSSHGAGKRRTLISPDVSVCSDCLKELHDPGNRRFSYPFINCTHCGPRYTIIKDIPYDRPKTAMAKFPLCPDCQREYDDPMDRRFHAQAQCLSGVRSPSVALVDSRGNCVANGPGDALEKSGSDVKKGVHCCRQGAGGISSVQWMPPANEAVTCLRAAKKRQDKPFALMARSTSHAARHVHITPDEESLLTSRHRPIVLLKKRFHSREKKSEVFVPPHGPGQKKVMRVSQPCCFSKQSLARYHVALYSASLPAFGKGPSDTCHDQR